MDKDEVVEDDVKEVLVDEEEEDIIDDRGDAADLPRFKVGEEDEVGEEANRSSCN